MLLLVLLFVFLFLVDLFLFIFILSLLCPFLPTMSFFAGYFLLVRCLLSAFLRFHFLVFFCSRFDLVWLGSVYLVTTAGLFVADHQFN